MIETMGPQTIEGRCVGQAVQCNTIFRRRSVIGNRYLVPRLVTSSAIQPTVEQCFMVVFCLSKLLKFLFLNIYDFLRHKVVKV